MNVSASMQWEVILLKFRHSSDEKKLIPEALKKNFVFSDLMDAISSLGCGL
jgi:hypothetical protein